IPEKIFKSNGIVLDDDIIKYLISNFLDPEDIFKLISAYYDSKELLSLIKDKNFYLNYSIEYDSKCFLKSRMIEIYDDDFDINKIPFLDNIIALDIGCDLNFSSFSMFINFKELDLGTQTLTNLVKILDECITLEKLSFEFPCYYMDGNCWTDSDDNS